MSATFIRQDNIHSITEYANTFVRQGAFPLERFSVFDTLSLAENYAKNDPRAYIGQQLVVVESANATPSSFVISGTGGSLVRIPNIYDLTSASDNITGKLDEHEQVSAASSVYGHVKLSNDNVQTQYGDIAVNSDGQLVAVAATSSTLGVSRACSRVGQANTASHHVIGIDDNKCIVLNIAQNHSGFEIIGEESPVVRRHKTVLKVNTGSYPLSENHHPTHDTETSRVVTDNKGELAVYPASADWYGAVKIGTDLLSSDYSRVPNCSAVKTAINTSIQGLSGTVNNKFLPLSGGIVTGSLTIQGSNNYVSQLDFGGASADAGLKVRGISGRLHDRPEKGSLFINYDSKDVSHEEYWTYDTDDGRGLFICGSGNDSLAVRKKDLIAYSSSVSSALSSAVETKLSNEYLPLSGGTISGNIGIGTGTAELTEKLQVDGGIKSTALSSENAIIYDTLSIGPININDGTVNGISRLEFANPIVIGLSIMTGPSSITIGNSSMTHPSSITIGNSSTTAVNSIAFGNSSTATRRSITFGNMSQSFNDSITIGMSAKSNHGSVVIGNNIEETSSNVIHIEANGDKDFDGEYGRHASLIINGDGLTITHQVSLENNGWKTEPSKVTITANTLDKLNHIDTIVTSGSVNLIESGAVYDVIHGDTVSIGSTTNTPRGTIEIIAIENELQNKLAVSSNGLTLAHPVSSSNENDEVVYSQDEVTLTADELKRIKNIENLKSTMVVREWDYTSTLPETTMTNNTMMIFRNWDLEQNHLDLIDEKLATV